MTTEEFVRDQLPPVPARVLEVGCGPDGRLARALARTGWSVLAIDPAAPPGEIFRPLPLEQLDPTEGPFDAVVASRSLHHVHDLDAALHRVATLLVAGGVLVVEEFAWDLADEATLQWLDEQHGRASRPGADVRTEWQADHAGLHGYGPLRSALASRFDERVFTWVPALHHELGSGPAEAREQAAIDAGSIRPLGFRWVGTSR